MGAKLSPLKNATDVPGPGHYNRASFDSIKSLKFGSGQRTSLGKVTNSPGPGGHNPEFTKVKSAAPKFGFGSETRNSGGDLKKNFPGPGNYQMKSLVGSEGMKSSMHRTIDYSPEKRENGFKPGPGNYDPDASKFKKREPAYKLGSSTRLDLATVKAAKF